MNRMSSLEKPRFLSPLPCQKLSLKQMWVGNGVKWKGLWGTTALGTPLGTQVSNWIQPCPAPGASLCLQMPYLFLSKRPVSWGKISQLRELKRHLNPLSGDTTCCAGFSTPDTSSPPGPTRCRQEVCSPSHPSPCKANLSSLSLLRART